MEDHYKEEKPFTMIKKLMEIKGTRTHNKGVRDASSERGSQGEIISAAMERAQEVQSNLNTHFPSFIKPMIRSNVAGGFWLSLPKLFCEWYLPNRESSITLVDENREEHYTKYLPYRRGFSAGWKGFSITHNLEEGDILVFHLVGVCRMKVYIVRENHFSASDAALSLLHLQAHAGSKIYDGSAMDALIKQRLARKRKALETSRPEPLMDQATGGESQVEASVTDISILHSRPIEPEEPTKAKKVIPPQEIPFVDISRPEGSSSAPFTRLPPLIKEKVHPAHIEMLHSLFADQDVQYLAGLGWERLLMYTAHRTLESATALSVIMQQASQVMQDASLSAKRIHDLSLERDRLKDELQDLKTIYTREAYELEDLRDNMAVTRGEVTNMRAELADKREELANLKADHEAYKIGEASRRAEFLKSTAFKELLTTKALAFLEFGVDTCRKHVVADGLLTPEQGEISISLDRVVEELPPTLGDDQVEEEEPVRPTL